MDVRYLILALFFLVSCMPTATVSKGNLASTDSAGGSTTGGTSTASPTSLTWNYLGQLVNSITINASNLNNAYIVGTPVEDYLSLSGNFSEESYCLISTFSVGGVVSELRSRIVPISYYDFRLKRTIKNMRVDFDDTSNGESICNKTSRVRNSNGDYVSDTSAPAASRIFYVPKLICPLCSYMLNASRVRIFKVGLTTLDEVPTNYINTSALDLQIDTNYSTVGDTGTCTNASCRSRGFNCCLENQCVNDGDVKPSASQYQSLLETSRLEMIQNPLAYLNYPQLYYICGTTVPSTGGSTPGGPGSYDEAFLQLKKDYQCIEHLKSQSQVTPFQLEVLSKTYAPATDCLTNSTQTSETFHYQNVLKRLYTTCGCNRTTLSDMVTNCPNYDYTVTTRDTFGEPVRIDCYTPPLDSGTIPQEQSVSVSGRSAPHRFFNKNGIEGKLSDGIEQEGDTFTYTDEEKILPIQQAFSMNAILGQMSVTLDQALPAKEVKVELDQVYFLSTTSGYYTPCPTCAKDSWLSSLTAFPSSSTGVGLQATGHTTERDAFSTNTTAGNYEDTIFGRACWLPPTMIPYSHTLKGSSTEQRRNRLLTQAALFVNGYQRDWFGFNKGALIGSFDGVTWFAIGKGRIVRSSSKKLFLAINAPFADLAAPTMHVVRVANYDGITQAAQLDYDPEYHQSHPFQNEAGNCQKYHMCSTDSDCITSLGWEYACADVKDLKTNWPTFDSNSVEQVVNPIVPVSLDQILQQKKFNSSSTKRCVYRGAGAVCHTNTASFTTDLNKRRLLTCGPNFFCGSVSSGVHNTRIARFAAPLEEIPVSRNHFFGKDANILGRPENYTATGSLPSEVRTTIINNFTPFEPSMTTSAGLCQPGKGLPTTPLNQTEMSSPLRQHQIADDSRRTDFISQIGSCNSALFNSLRHTSCPILSSDGNYEIFTTANLTSGYSRRATNQNACGLESLLPTASLTSSADLLLSSSPFRSIEAKPLNSQIIVDKTLVRDACYRRAGAVCHTDLDCSPNKMHADQVDFFSNSFFGNLAEKSFWSEYLVCGQVDAKPLPTDTEAFKNYDMSKNRCCREIGKDLTTYTSDLPLDTNENYESASVGLRMTTLPGVRPNDARRYSRLSTVLNLGSVNATTGEVLKPALSAYQNRTASVLENNPTFPGGTNVKSPHQWKTLTEANSESCCGGGWIRKFSDGSNDWTRRDRLVLDVNNFRCINSRTPLITHPEDVVSEYNDVADVTRLVSQDYGDYCKDSTNTSGSCAQFSVLDSRFDVLPQNSAGVDYDPTLIVNTIKPDFNRITNGDYYFKPKSADTDPAVIVDLANTNTGARRFLAIKIPSFVSRSEFDAKIATITINMTTADGPPVACARDLTYNPTIGAPWCATVGGCCYNYNSSTRVLKVGMGTTLAGTTFDKKKVGIDFTVATPGYNSSIRRTKPGSTSYYLKRLGHLELSGIPQITFEALTCNDNNNRIVPGIFLPGIKYLEDISAAATADNTFAKESFSFLHAYDAQNESGGNVLSGNRYFTNKHGLTHEPVFSSNDFKCCSPLGKTVTDASMCCSGFGVDIGTNGTRKTCAIPDGANLMVYFNRFVSNEGQGTDQPGGGLLETDFDNSTGEPLRVAAVSDKIRSLGEAYCASGTVRQGGAFGSFEPEPQGTETNLTAKIYNIVDSPRDIGQTSNAGKTVQSGYAAFMDGFKWNHHLYCDDSGN